ncbi:MAG: CHRD domain-containing protein [Candidatus Krumholzibacteriia bacterium]
MRIWSKRRILGVLAWLASVTAVRADVYVTTVTLDESQVVPPTGSSATGTASVTINTGTNTLAFSLTHDAVNPFKAHIHEAPAGSNGPILFDFSPGTSPIDDVWAYDESQEASILDGNMHFIVHTPLVPTGEIRGQIDNLALQHPGVQVPASSAWSLTLLGLVVVGVGISLVVRRESART